MATRPMNFTHRFVFCGLMSVSLIGCTSSLYDWGSYEQSLYMMYTKTDKYVLEKDIGKLSAEIQKTLDKDKRVPPGKHAHLGYLFHLSGDTASATQHFQAEKNTFPESAKLMDRMLEPLN